MPVYNPSLVKVTRSGHHSATKGGASPGFRHFRDTALVASQKPDLSLPKLTHFGHSRRYSRTVITAPSLTVPLSLFLAPTLGRL